MQSPAILGAVHWLSWPWKAGGAPSSSLEEYPRVYLERQRAEGEFPRPWEMIAHICKVGR